MNENDENSNIEKKFKGLVKLCIFSSILLMIFSLIFIFLRVEYYGPIITGLAVQLFFYVGYSAYKLKKEYMKKSIKPIDI